MPFAIFLLVLFGLLLLVTPFLTIALFAREAKLRRQLNELAEENAKQHTKLQRAVGELQSKLAAAPAATAPVAEKSLSPEPRPPVPVPRSVPTEQVPAPTVVVPIVAPIKETPVVTPRIEAKPCCAATPPIIPPAVVTPPQETHSACRPSRAETPHACGRRLLQLLISGGRASRRRRRFRRYALLRRNQHLSSA